MPRPKQEVLDELARVAEELQRTEDLAKRRDKLVLEATRAAASRSEVGRAAGVSRGRVQQIVTEAKKEADMKKVQTGLAAALLVVGIGAGLAISAGDNERPTTDDPPRPNFVTAASVKSEFREGGGSRAEWVAMLPQLTSQQIEMVCDLPPDRARSYDRKLSDARFRPTVLSALSTDCEG